MSWARRSGFAALGMLVLAVIGCGTPGPPQPPSLNLPDRVGDLAAVRSGNQVALTWTMPKRNTDKIALKGPVAVHICRIERTAPCTGIADLTIAPAAAGSFSETLPPALAVGAPRPIRYFVELTNKNGRSAGQSNAAVALAGEAPRPVTGFSAELRKSGIVLHWTADGENIAIRLHRTLVSGRKAPAQAGPLKEPAEPAEQNFLIENDAGRALDRSIVFGQTYEYTAQRIARVQADGKALELASTVSAPIRIEALDIFPPAAPTGLVAVATVPEGGTKAAIDLNWQPNSESDLAGYFVYRREGDGGWQRISPAQPQIAPAFHDTQIQPGHTYMYAVSAVDHDGHESARSAEAQETAPQSQE